MNCHSNNSESLRILFTSGGYKPAYRVGGPTVVVFSLAEALVRQGHSVTVFTTNGNMSEDIDVPLNCPQSIEGVEVWYFKRRELLKKVFPFISYLSQSVGYLYAPDMAKQLKKAVPAMDLVHTHMPFIYPTIAAGRAARMQKKPYFYHQYGALCPEHLSRRSIKKKIYIECVERSILKNATGLFALTRHECDAYRELGVGTHCDIMPLGVAVEEYSGEHSSLIESELGLAPDENVVLFMGRIHPVKCVDRLLDAFFKISNVVNRAKLVIAGPDEYGLTSQWKERVRQSGLNGQILFLDYVADTVKSALLARADLFCLPSHAEGFSIAVLEALASGTAVMISPGCHFPEVERAGIGKVVAAEPDAMAKTMIELFKDRKMLREMGRKGIEYVTQNHSWGAIASELIDAYREGIARHAIENET